MKVEAYLKDGTMARAIAKGMTLEEYAQKNGLTAEELKEQIKSTFKPQKAQYYLRELNRKPVKRGRGRPKKDSTANIESQILVEDESKEEVVELSELEILEAEVSKLTDMCAEEEKNHQSLITKRNQVDEEARNLFKELSEIYEKYTQMVNEKKEALESLEVKIAKSNELISGYREKIEFDNALIKEISAIIVYAFESGEIQIESNDEVLVDEAEVDSKFMSLIMDKRVEKLSVLEIKMLARLLILKDMINLKIIFDRKEVEEVYIEISA